MLSPQCAAASSSSSSQDCGTWLASLVSPPLTPRLLPRKSVGASPSTSLLVRLCPHPPWQQLTAARVTSSLFKPSTVVPACRSFHALNLTFRGALRPTFRYDALLLLLLMWWLLLQLLCLLLSLLSSNLCIELLDSPSCAAALASAASVLVVAVPRCVLVWSQRIVVEAPKAGASKVGRYGRCATGRRVSTTSPREGGGFTTSLQEWWRSTGRLKRQGTLVRCSWADRGWFLCKRPRVQHRRRPRRCGGTIPCPALTTLPALPLAAALNPPAIPG